MKNEIIFQKMRSIFFRKKQPVPKNQNKADEQRVSTQKTNKLMYINNSLIQAILLVHSTHALTFASFDHLSGAFAYYCIHIHVCF